MSGEQGPYTAPHAALARYGEGSGSMVKAVAIGVGVDAACSAVFGTIFFVVYAAHLNMDPFAPEAEGLLIASAHYLRSVLAMGCGFLVLGGYVAAHVANRDRLRTGLYYAAATMALSVVFLPYMNAYPTWYVVLSYALTPLCCVAGALLWRVRDSV